MYQKSCSRLANELDCKSSKNILQAYIKSCNDLWEQRWQLKYSDLVRFSVSVDKEEASQSNTDCGGGLPCVEKIPEENKAEFNELWQQKYHEMVDLKERNGQCLVSKTTPNCERAIQRLDYKKSK